MVYLDLARRLGLAGGHGCGLAKTNWSCQLARCLGLASLEYTDVLGTWDNRHLKDTFDL